MNDLGLTLVWLAVQVALLLVPALALHTLATRRGPASGAWVAALSLGLVVVLNVAAFLPGIGRDAPGPAAEVALSLVGRPDHSATARPTVSSGRVERHGGGDLAAVGQGRARVWLRLSWAWDRLERGAAGPAARFRPWAGTVAAVALAGIGVGLLHLMVGLWAVALCRRRGQAVDDPGITGLVEELRHLMECSPPVALRAVPDLATPATAGHRRPVLLLPFDWRSWDAAERRAVLAHELAHIVRGDYAVGLLARLAVVLHSYHPMVRWMAGRLQLQQEQAADALAARFAGGRARYLVALSSLALRQDGCSPWFPARAFLPARGTLIRRIAMLRDQSAETSVVDRPWPGAHRLLTLVGLAGLAAGLAMLRGPARGAEDRVPSAAPAPATTAPSGASAPARPFETPFVRAGADGVVMLRPAAAFRRAGMDRLLPVIGEAVDTLLEAEFRVDNSRPGSLKLRCQDIDWLTAGVGFGRSKNDTAKKPLHSLILGNPAIRMTAPFDWLTFLRQGRWEIEAIPIGGHAYYKLRGPIPLCLFLPDDRTIVFDEEGVVRRLAGGEEPAPSFFPDADWERASRGLVAVAIRNRDDSFARHYDLDRPDDAMVLSLFQGVDGWVFGVDDADAIVLRANATCRDRKASAAVRRSLDSLIRLGHQALEHLEPRTPDSGAHDLSLRILKGLMAGVRVDCVDKSITVRAEGFGALADFAAIVEAETHEQKQRTRDRKAAQNSPKR